MIATESDPLSIVLLTVQTQTASLHVELWDWLNNLVMHYQERPVPLVHFNHKELYLKKKLTPYLGPLVLAVDSRSQSCSANGLSIAAGHA